MSSVSPEFAIHVPSEYDCHFISKNKDQIAQLLTQLYLAETQTQLIVVYSDLQNLKDIVLTKKLAKFESRNSKHAMQQSISDTKDILKKLDENPSPIDMNNMNTKVEEFQGCEIVYTPVVENGARESEDYAEDEEETNNENTNPNDNGNSIAMYQSLVYGNQQLLLREENKLKNTQ
eukprot:374877_1